MARLGMDVDAVERIGNGLQSDADQLASLTSKIDATVRRLVGAWHGRDASDFVESSWPQHRASLGQVRAQIAGLGQAALNNATEQRGASGETSGGGAVSRQPGETDNGSWWLNRAGQVHGGTELIFGLGAEYEMPPVFGKLGKFLGGVGIATATVDGAQAYLEGDWGRLGGAGVDLGLAAAGLVAAPQVAVGFAAFGVAKAVIDASIPYSAQSQDQLLDYQAKRMFGTTDLSPSQANQLAEHYSGPLGPVNMISDKVNESTDEAVEMVGGVVRNGTEGITSIWNWATGH
ncbi:hypothetical protein [Pengzhenrongella sicca]|uniref:WXG100 family type VII secretion target n=1 Tax=Pengzhenrongella sicca TaxID=2819238 RepID=A0A8A4ZEL0_9MICO|nr:hypothetical protein [Pengzhenrongella sicca]QTE28986.1 hypothetical protein J4E96_17000 [Pengzhenrongella sicca]